MNDSDCLSNLVTAQKPRKLEVEIAIVEDVQKAVDDMGTTVDKAEEEKEDFDENILMMLGPRLFWCKELSAAFGLLHSRDQSLVCC